MQRPVNEAQGFCLQFLLKHQFSKSLRTGGGRCWGQGHGRRGELGVRVRRAFGPPGHPVSRGVTLIGLGVRLVSFLLEAFPGLPGCRWPPDSPVTLLAQTLISSGVLFIMINAEMINENANDGEVPQPSALSIINSSPLANRSLSRPVPAFSGAHGWRPARRRPALGGAFLPICLSSSFAENLFGTQSSNIFPAEMITILGQ